MSFYLAFSTVFPMFFYMAAGFGLRRSGRVSAQTVGELNKIIYSFCFPFVLFNNIYHVDVRQASNLGFIALMAAIVLLVTGLAYVMIPLWFKEKPVQGSMIQGVVRGNSILFAIPVVSSVAGPDQLGLVTLSVSVIVPFYNVLCVIILESLRGGKVKGAQVLLSVLKNPIIVGTLAGLLVRLTGLSLPGWAEQVTASVAALVTPVALVLLGADMRFSDTLRYRRELAVVCALKLIAVPLVTVLIVRAMGFDRVAVATAMGMTAVPTAVSSYVMARELGADDVLAGQIVAVGTAASLLTVFIWVYTLSRLGWV